jgi:hypothetical protein
MRFLVKVSMPVEGGNAVMRDGSMPKKFQSILAELKPEAAYFAEEDGERMAFIFVNIDDPSQIPAVAEPFFLALNAAVHFSPAMTVEDLMKAWPAIERAVKNYG